MKKFVSVILIAVLCLSVFGSTSAFALTDILNGFSRIYTAKQLDEVRNELDGKYILMNDIDLSSFENWEPIGTSDEPFTGIFDGDGYSINNLKISVTPQSEYDVKKCGIGLFGFTDDAEIGNLDMNDVNIIINQPCEVGYPVGAVVGSAKHSKISSCAVSGNIDVTLGGNIELGGILGEGMSSNMNNVVSYCINNINLKVTGKNDGFSLAVGNTTKVGGLVGASDGNVNILSCINNGSISIYPINKVVVGGIASSDYGWVTDCGNNGDIFVSGSATAGGILGESYYVSECYNNGKITVTDETNSKVGGIAGYSTFEPATDGTIPAQAAVNCYYIDSFDCAISNVDNSSLVSVEALSAENMKQQSSFKGFDFENVWTINDGNTPTIIRDVYRTGSQTNYLSSIAIIFGKVFNLLSDIFSRLFKFA